jgi:hypothetical protein
MPQPEPQSAPLSGGAPAARGPPTILSGPLLSLGLISALPCFSNRPPPRACQRAAAGRGASTRPRRLPFPYRTGLPLTPHLLGCCGLHLPAALFQRVIIPLLTHRSCTTAGGEGPCGPPPPRRLSLPASLRPLTNRGRGPTRTPAFYAPNCIRPAILIARPALAAGAGERPPPPGGRRGPRCMPAQ